MGKSPKSLLFCCCLVLVGLVLIVQARKPKPLVLPRICPETEFFTDCGGACQTECSTLGKPCLIRNIRCPDGCYCNEGLARDDSGRCIPIADCPKQVD